MRYTLPTHDAGAGSDPGLLAALGFADPSPAAAPGPGVGGDVRPAHAGTLTADQLSERCGKLTGSNVYRIIPRGKAAKGEPAKPFSDDGRKYMLEIIAERLEDANVRRFVSAAMEHGVETEPEAREVFRRLSGLRVTLAPFTPHPTIPDFGATPDGLVEDDELLEVKCPTTANFLLWKSTGEIPEKYRHQMTAQLACTGRQRVHFFAYDPRIKNPAHRYWHTVFEPSGNEIAALEARACEFLAWLEETFEALTTVPDPEPTALAA